jgi:hypothetical protein
LAAPTKEALVSRRHATIISVFLALALVLGVAAVLRTGGAGAASAGARGARNAQLDRYESQLRTAANAQPPAVPAAAATEPPRVVYVRAPQTARPQHDDDHDGHERDHDGEQHDRGGHDDD